jgi:UTP-glucose-1-phosphate uridylyltransferase
MNRKTLLILAAGMGSRYGGLKQLDQVGPNGETIIDYSVYDALKAGFNKLVFIIRNEFLDAMKSQVTSKFEGLADILFVDQAVDSPIEGISVPMGRLKPWGTGHAVLVARNVINEPFAVINADDFYGRDGFFKMSAFLEDQCKLDVHGLIAYILKNTLSDNGYVSRGVCSADEEGNLTEINERTKIERRSGIVYYKAGDNDIEVDENSLVSMNFWGFHPSIFDVLHQGFSSFIEKSGLEPSAEYFIPLVADQCIQSGIARFKTVPSNDKWYGVTYKEDKADVQAALQSLVDQKRYPSPLF